MWWPKNKEAWDWAVGKFHRYPEVDLKNMTPLVTRPLKQNEPHPKIASYRAPFLKRSQI